jgi:hypothetical protein
LLSAFGCQQADRRKGVTGYSGSIAFANETRDARYIL